MNKLTIEYREKKARGRKPQKYLILDTETATLPFVNDMVTNQLDKRTLAIAKPLIYDIAWKIVDSSGFIYSRHSYLVSEIFSVPSLFNTAYYNWKRPIYLERLKNGETSVMGWNDIMLILQEDLNRCDFVGAFNSMFDYKKAIPFTEKYIDALYSPEYQKWEFGQKKACEKILQGSKYENHNWDGENFDFRDNKYPLIDLWGIACQMLINTKEYKTKCLQHDMITESGKFFKSSAETTFRYLCKKYDFEELHLAIDDVNIECEILQVALKRGSVPKGLDYFPFQRLGTTTDFVIRGKKTPVEQAEFVIETMEKKLGSYDKESTFRKGLETDMYKMIRYVEEKHNRESFKTRLKEGIKLNKLESEIARKEIRLAKLKTDKKIYEAKEELCLLKEKFDDMEFEYLEVYGERL